MENSWTFQGMIWWTVEKVLSWATSLGPLRHSWLGFLWICLCAQGWPSERWNLRPISCFRGIAQCWLAIHEAYCLWIIAVSDWIHGKTSTVQWNRRNAVWGQEAEVRKRKWWEERWVRNGNAEFCAFTHLFIGLRDAGFEMARVRIIRATHFIFAILGAMCGYYAINRAGGGIKYRSKRGLWGDYGNLV